MKRIFLACPAALAVTLAAPGVALATEGGAGRPITGQQVYSNAGIITAAAGKTLVQLNTIYYAGSLAGNKQVPVANDVSAGIKSDVSYTLAEMLYVWGNSGRWEFATGGGVPLQWTKVTASFQARRLNSEQSDSSTNIADVLLVPIAAGYHFSKTSHLAIELPIYAPTANYDSNKLSNPGQNVWTFMPTVSYTWLQPEAGVEFTTMAAMEFYTRNKDTNYHSGDLFRLDALFTKRISGGWSAGVVSGWIQQVTDDTGPVAERLNGFKGMSFGVGPIVNWQGKIGSNTAVVSARWVPDIVTRNRAKGNGVAANLTMTF